MDTETKVKLIKEFAEEIVTEEELERLFETNHHPVAYDGFEPSGLAPIHFGLLRATNLENMLKAGVKFKLYLADYFAFINNKLGGNLEDIRLAGEYFIEVWKACGIDTSKVEIVWAKDIMDGIDYWDKTLRIAREISLERNLRAITIMGRKQGEKLSMGQLFYPPMQVTDIFHMDINICQLGMDQRRANMLARDVADKLKWKKPVVVHHHILLGLQGIQKKKTAEETLMASKMSKSDPKTCIYMHDSYDELKKKINMAYCPPKQEEGNPLLEYCKYILFKETNFMKIERNHRFGGDIEFKSYEELRNAYVKGELHPADLKKGVVEELNKLIKPVREYFEKNKRARELYERVKKFQITK
ncbi:MAG TPA: tyrosine--tRNA ligase [Candidatus Aenigmarchaeota archaeon]|nr:tyrosine--tRNA ligase [Candidatus Aenigmarchaeota archaeon]